MKILASLSFLLFSCFVGLAQSVEYSPPFIEPGGHIESKVFQCSNGNTLLFSFTIREGMFVSLFDTAHRIKMKRPIVGRGWDARETEKTEIRGIYEIHDSVVMFVQQEIDKQLFLFRLIFDPATGAITEHKKIVESEKYTRGEAYAVYVGSDPKKFYVVKDKYSGCYAVARFDGLAPKDKAHITVTHFDGSHKEINSAAYVLPAEDDYKFIRYLDMVVDSTRSIHLTSYAFDNRASGGKRSKVFFSKLNSDSKAFIHQPMEMTDDFKETTAAMAFNRSSNTIDMLLLTLTDSKTKNKITHRQTTNYYMLLHTSVDASSLAVKFSRPLPLAKVAAHSRDVLKTEGDYFGLPQNFLINDDFSTTVTFETIENGVDARKPGSMPTNLQDMAALDLDKDGREQQAYAASKRQNSYARVTPFAQYERDRRSTALVDHNIGSATNTYFFSYDVVTTPTARYMIYNDRIENFSRQPPQELETMRAWAESVHAVCQKFSGGTSSKFSLFSPPEKDAPIRVPFISSSHFLSSTNTYAVMLVEKIGREKKARVAWVKFD
jgi:hypothetical protein